jgi:SAM-dependent methyltransferase
MSPGESAQRAYDRYAAVYDESNAENDYEMWLGEVLLPELEQRGLQKGWALDVGCGTGRAFDPLLARGWQVVGCDVSSGMLDEAQRKFGCRVRLLPADARDLPLLAAAPGSPAGEGFDLILLLNDVVNYVIADGDLERVFGGVRRNLSGRGLVVFDANTLSLFRGEFASGAVAERGPGGWQWRGLTEMADVGAIFEAELSGQGFEPQVHRQRHWTQQQVRDALELVGLRCLAALGQREEGGRVLLADSPDEERDAKVIYVAAR